jgi:hypothetical protein
MLYWIAAQPVTPLLSDLYTRFPEESIWPMIEELYRSGLVNIGRKEGAAAPIQPTDVCLDLPVGLRARFTEAE